MKSTTLFYLALIGCMLFFRHISEIRVPDGPTDSGSNVQLFLGCQVPEDECFCDEGCFIEDQPFPRILCCTVICQWAEDKGTQEQCAENCSCYEEKVKLLNA